MLWKIISFKGIYPGLQFHLGALEHAYALKIRL